jgi:hypothetical protein
MSNEFGLKELYELTLKATYPIEMEGRKFEAGEVIARFDKIQIANFKELTSRVSANGGKSNPALVIWEDPKEIQLTFTQGVFSKRQFALLSNANLIKSAPTDKFLLSARFKGESDEEGKIEIDYPNTYTLVRYLIDYVRPVGMGVELRAIAAKNINTDALLIYADTESMVREYIPLFDSGVSKNFVNFSIVGDPDYEEHIKQWQDAVGDQNSTFSFGGD